MDSEAGALMAARIAIEDRFYYTSNYDPYRCRETTGRCRVTRRNPSPRCSDHHVRVSPFRVVVVLQDRDVRVPRMGGSRAVGRGGGHDAPEERLGLLAAGVSDRLIT